MIDQLAFISEATRRALEDGFLSAGKPLNIPQREGLLNFHTFLTEPTDHKLIDKRRAYFDMATGTGKTGMFSVVTRHVHFIAREQGYGSDFKTIIVVPTTILLKQTYDALIASAPELKGAVGIYGGGNKDMNFPVTIMTWRAWSDLNEGGHLNGVVDFEVDDESHHKLSERRQQYTREYVGNAMHMGVTASSQYDNQKTMELTHQNLIYKIGLRNAIERGFLTDYAHVQFAVARILRDHVRGSETQKVTGTMPRLRQREWSNLVVRAYATLNDEISGQPLSDKIAAIFAGDTDHADKVADMLNAHPLLRQKALARGYKDVAISVHSKGHSPAVQDKRLAAFRAGEYMAITGDQKIGPGFDHPPIKFAACYPGNSLVDLLQEIGRSTRYWVDPVTGLSQGTVIFEAIPYIGDADEEKDRKSQTTALANTKTVYEILKGSFVYAPSRAPKTEPKRLTTSRKIDLSPHVTAEVFTTLEDTILVSKMIDRAREELRIDITASMRAELRAKIYARGNYSAAKLMEYVAEYEREHNLKTTDMLYYDISGASEGNVKTMQIKKWQRLNEVLDVMPLVEVHERIPVTDIMLGHVRDKVTLKGGLGYVLLTREVGRYEETKKLPSVELTEPLVSRIISGGLKSIESRQWTRFNDVLDAMPNVTIAERVELTPLMIITIKQKIAATGEYGAVQLMRYIEQFERDRTLASVGLTHQILGGIIYAGSYKSIETAQWQRLNDAVASLPVVPLGERIEVTVEMLDELKRKIAETGGFAGEKLLTEIDKYEARNGFDTTGITVGQIAGVLARSSKTIQHYRWRRLHDAIDELPKLSEREQLELQTVLAERRAARELSNRPHRERVPFTTLSLAELKKKIKERGDFGSKRLLTEILSYEEIYSLAATGITQPIIESIISGYLQTVDKLQWDRLNEVIDTLPLQMVLDTIDVTPEMYEQFRTKIEAKGSFGAYRLLAEIERFEAAFNLPNLQLTKSLMEHLYTGTAKTIATVQWQRINAVLNVLPEIGDRIKISATMRAELFDLIRLKGDLGASLLAKEVLAYESEHFPEQPSGITQGILSSIYEGTVHSMLRLQWTRLKKTLEALPESEPENRIDITAALTEALIAKIKERGNPRNKRLMNAIRNFEAEKKLAPTGVTEQILHHILGGRAKTVNKDQWDRIHAVLDSLPLRRRDRIALTEPMLTDLKNEIRRRGEFGARALFGAIKDHEKLHTLPDTGITEPIIVTIVSGDLSTVVETQWQRLVATVKELPLKEPSERIEVTKENWIALNAKYNAKGRLGFKYIVDKLKEFEKEKDLKPTGINIDMLRRLMLDERLTCGKLEWDRFNALLDSLPDKKARAEISLTPDMLEALRKKRAERGNFGAVILRTMCQKANPDIEMTITQIAPLFLEGHIVLTTDKQRWDALNAVLDKLPIIDPESPSDAEVRTNLLRQNRKKGQLQDTVKNE